MAAITASLKPKAVDYAKVSGDVLRAIGNMLTPGCGITLREYLFLFLCARRLGAGVGGRDGRRWLSFDLVCFPPSQSQGRVCLVHGPSRVSQPRPLPGETLTFSRLAERGRRFPP